MVSSFLVIVPSGDWVTVFSLDFTVPSLLTLLLSVLEISRSQPTIRNDKAKTDVAAKVLTIDCEFFIVVCLIVTVLFPISWSRAVFAGSL